MGCLAQSRCAVNIWGCFTATPWAIRLRYRPGFPGHSQHHRAGRALAPGRGGARQKPPSLFASLP